MTALEIALIQLAAQYGIPLVMDLLQKIEAGQSPVTLAMWQDLITKYGTKTAAEILAAQTKDVAQIGTVAAVFPASKVN